MTTEEPTALPAGFEIEPNRIYKTAEAPFTKSYLNKLAMSGGGPVFMQPGGPGTPRFYRGADLLAWLEGARVRSTSESALKLRKRRRAREGA